MFYRSVPSELDPHTLATPFYFSMRESLVEGVPDTILTLITPIITFWVFSVAFDLLDRSGWECLDSYRIHETDEVKSRNLVSRLDVVLTVMSQQVAQIVLGLVFLGDLQDISLRRCGIQLQAMKMALIGFTEHAAPKPLGNILKCHMDELAYALYWWVIPVVQICLALLISDTWMYFGHRYMHINKFLYKHVHSMHHRLYVPYAYGGMYNHPLEWFILDMTGTYVASKVPCLSPRQNLLFFTFGVMKSIHQHSGYLFPYDPFRWFSENGPDYHDVHHQTIGIKYNFSQPFFIHWDVIMGTRLTREDMKERSRKVE